MQQRFELINLQKAITLIIKITPNVAPPIIAKWLSQSVADSDQSRFADYCKVIKAVIQEDNVSHEGLKQIFAPSNDSRIFLNKLTVVAGSSNNDDGDNEASIFLQLLFSLICRGLFPEMYYVELLTNQKELLFGYIKTLNIMNQYAALKQALDQQHPLGKVFWLQRGKFKPSINRGILKELKILLEQVEELTSLVCSGEADSVKEILEQCCNRNAGDQLDIIINSKIPEAFDLDSLTQRNKQMQKSFFKNSSDTGLTYTDLNTYIVTLGQITYALQDDKQQLERIWELAHRLLTKSDLINILHDKDNVSANLYYKLIFQLVDKNAVLPSAVTQMLLNIDYKKIRRAGHVNEYIRLLDMLLSEETVSDILKLVSTDLARPNERKEIVGEQASIYIAMLKRIISMSPANNTEVLALFIGSSYYRISFSAAKFSDLEYILQVFSEYLDMLSLVKNKYSSVAWVAVSRSLINRLKSVRANSVHALKIFDESKQFIREHFFDAEFHISSSVEYFAELLRAFIAQNMEFVHYILKWLHTIKIEGADNLGFIYEVLKAENAAIPTKIFQQATNFDTKKYVVFCRDLLSELNEKYDLSLTDYETLFPVSALEGLKKNGVLRECFICFQDNLVQHHQIRIEAVFKQLILDKLNINKATSVTLCDAFLCLTSKEYDYDWQDDELVKLNQLLCQVSKHIPKAENQRELLNVFVNFLVDHLLSCGSVEMLYTNYADIVHPIKLYLDQLTPVLIDRYIELIEHFSACEGFSLGTFINVFDSPEFFEALNANQREKYIDKLNQLAHKPIFETLKITDLDSWKNSGYLREPLAIGFASIISRGGNNYELGDKQQLAGQKTLLAMINYISDLKLRSKFLSEAKFPTSKLGQCFHQHEKKFITNKLILVCPLKRQIAESIDQLKQETERLQGKPTANFHDKPVTDSNYEMESAIGDMSL